MAMERHGASTKKLTSLLIIDSVTAAGSANVFRNFGSGSRKAEKVRGRNWGWKELELCGLAYVGSLAKREERRLGESRKQSTAAEHSTAAGACDWRCCKRIERGREV